MAAVIVPASLQTNSRYGGRTDVGAKVLALDGTILAARVVATEASSGSGFYRVSLTCDSAWGTVRVVWDCTGIPALYAEDTVNLANQVALDSVGTGVGVVGRPS